MLRIDCLLRRAFRAATASMISSWRLGYTNIVALSPKFAGGARPQSWCRATPLAQEFCVRARRYKVIAQNNKPGGVFCYTCVWSSGSRVIVVVPEMVCLLWRASVLQRGSRLVSATVLIPVFLAQEFCVRTRRRTTPPLTSTYDFAKNIIGYDLAAFFQRNQRVIKRETAAVLRKLLEPA